MNPNWHNVSRREPCPVCHKPDWCTVSNDGAVCVCRRVESPHPARSGSGWIHVLREAPRPVPAIPAGGERRVWAPPAIDAARVFEALPVDAAFAGRLAERLGVPQEALARLDVRRDPFTGAAAFPMRDEDGRVAGIRYRDVETGRKWSLRGGRDGLFMPAGAMAFPHGEAIVCEGASDTAAALALGLAAVGRSSCTSGTETLRVFCARHRIRFLTIVADNDEPGRAGAARLAEALALTCRVAMPPPPHKDLRAWYVATRPTPQEVLKIFHRSGWGKLPISAGRPLTGVREMAAIKTRKTRDEARTGSWLVS